MVELAASGQHHGRTPDGYREVVRNGDVSGRMWAISARGRRTSRVTACRCRTAREQTVAHKVLSAGLRRVPRRRCSETSIAARLTRGLQGADDPAESVIVGIGREWVRQTTGAGRGLHLRSLGGNIGGTPNLRGGSRRRLLPTSSWSRRTERWSGRADRRSGRRGGAASDPSRRTTGRRAGLPRSVCSRSEPPGEIPTSGPSAARRGREVPVCRLVGSTRHLSPWCPGTAPRPPPLGRTSHMAPIATAPQPGQARHPDVLEGGSRPGPTRFHGRPPPSCPRCAHGTLPSPRRGPVCALRSAPRSPPPTGGDARPPRSARRPARPHAHRPTCSWATSQRRPSPSSVRRSAVRRRVVTFAHLGHRTPAAGGSCTDTTRPLPSSRGRGDGRPRLTATSRCRRPSGSSTFEYGTLTGDTVEPHQPCARRYRAHGARSVHFVAAIPLARGWVAWMALRRDWTTTSPVAVVTADAPNIGAPSRPDAAISTRRRNTAHGCVPDRQSQALEPHDPRGFLDGFARWVVLMGMGTRRGIL